jgi:hypothetical protein
METYWEVEVLLHHGGEWCASRSGRLIPRERIAGTDWIGGLVDPRASLDAVEKRKISCPARNWNPAIHPVARHFIDWTIPASNQYGRIVKIYEHSWLVNIVRQSGSIFCLMTQYFVNYLIVYASLPFWHWNSLRSSILHSFINGSTALC